MPFQKGVSGNPLGRPKIAGQVKELAYQYGPKAFMKVVQLMDSDDERVVFAAAQEILNRAYGKPTQAIEHQSDGGPIIVMWAGEEELARRRSELQAQGAIPRLPSPN